MVVVEVAVIVNKYSASTIRMSGQGVNTFPNGNRYIGEWMDGAIRSGEGVITFCNGDRYEGAWIEFRMSGRGVITYSDGAWYDGEWANGR